MAEKHGQAPLSQKGGKEPAWWEQRKAEAWKKFQAMPMPKRSEEDWRFATIDAIRLGKFQPGGKGASLDAEIVKRSVAAFPQAGRAVFANDRLLHFEGGEELQKKGVIFESLSGALQKHPELLQKYFMAHASEYTLPTRAQAKIVSADSPKTLAEALELVSQAPYVMNKRLPDVTFGLGKVEISEGMNKIQQELFLLMAKNRDYVVEISGHQDASEADTLADARVNVLVKYLMKKGIGSMYGTEANRTLLRALRIRTSSGWSSTRAGPIFVPMVPAANNTEVKAMSSLRIRATVVPVGFHHASQHCYGSLCRGAGH